MRDELIIKYITGNSSPEEALSIQEWLDEHASNRLYFATLERIWDASKGVSSYEYPELEQAWQRFKAKRTLLESSIVRDVDVQVLPVFPWYKIRFAAAAILLLLGTLVWYTLVRSDAAELSELLAGNQILKMELPDQSKVTLNKHTILKYDDFKGTSRNVELIQGEAFFEVQRNEQQPFVIQAGASRIRVLGTSFQVSRQGDQTEVIVASGAVSVQAKARELVLKPLQVVRVKDHQTTALRADTVPDQLYRYYVNQQFIFENTPLSRVVQVLNKAFDQKLVLSKEEYKKLTLTSTFEQQSFSEIVQVILKTFDLKLEKQGDSYLIK